MVGNPILVPDVPQWMIPDDDGEYYEDDDFPVPDIDLPTPPPPLIPDWDNPEGDDDDSSQD